jgi:uncharacterized membrane protein
MEFEDTMENIAKGFEAVGVAIIVIGGVLALVRGFRDFADATKYFDDVKRTFGRPLILGLEVLVAADIIKTVTVEATLESVTVLAILVAVRIALSFSLDIEIDGYAPWRKAEIEEHDKELTQATSEAEG